MEWSRRVDIAGLGVEVEAADGEWSEAAASAIAALPDACAAPDGRVQIGVEVGPAPARPPDGADPSFRWWAGPDGLRLETPAGVMVQGDGPTVLIGRRASAPRAAAEAVVHPLLPFAMAALLAPTGMALLHAGAVLIEGKAVVVLGTSGAGKSTVSATAHLAGLPVLGDDQVVVRQAHNHCEALGVHRRPAVPPEIIAAVPSGSPIIPIAPLEGDHRGRWDVNVPAPPPGWWRVGAVVVVDHGREAATASAPLPSWEAIRHCWTAPFTCMVAGHARAWFPTAAELARLPTARLSLGADPARRAATTAGVLCKVLEDTAAFS